MNWFRLIFVLIAFLSLLMSSTFAQENVVGQSDPDLLAQFDPDNPEYQLQNRLLFEEPVDIYNLRSGGGNLRPNASVSDNPVGKLSQGTANIRIKGVALTGDEFTSGSITTDDWLFITGLDADGNEYSLDSSDPNSSGVWIWLGLLKPQLDTMPSNGDLSDTDLIEDQILFRQIQELESDFNLQVKPTSVRLQIESIGNRDLHPDTTDAKAAAIDRYIDGLKSDYTERLGTQSEAIDFVELVSHSDPEGAPFVRLIPFETDAEGNLTSVFMPIINPETQAEELTQVLIPQGFGSSVSVNESGTLSLTISYSSEKFARYSFAEGIWVLDEAKSAQGFTQEMINQIAAGTMTVEDAYASLGIVPETPPERNELLPSDIEFTLEMLEELFDLKSLPAYGSNWGSTKFRAKEAATSPNFKLMDFSAMMKVGTIRLDSGEIFAVAKFRNVRGESYFVVEMSPNVYDRDLRPMDRVNVANQIDSGRGSFWPSPSGLAPTGANSPRSAWEYDLVCEGVLGVNSTDECDDLLDEWQSFSVDADTIVSDLENLPAGSVYNAKGIYMVQF